jgi:uncharacterized repeat protein (TIGR02543 family)
MKWSINLDEYYPIGWGPGAGAYCYSSNVPPVAADINNDGWKEIFLCIGYDHDIRNPPQLEDEGTLYALDPQTGVPFWWYHCDDFGSHTVLSLHDLDGDGDLEVLATGYHNITAFHAENGAILWNKNYPNNREDKPALVINENGNIWVYTCQNRYDTYEETIQKRWGSNGSIAQEAAFPGPIHPCHGGLSCADINNDGELEIISVDRNYGANHQGVSCWTLNLEKLWSQPGIACSTSCGILLDVNTDGFLDIVVETASDGLYIINGDDGTIQKSGTGLGFSSGEIYTPAIYDIDQDGRYEVIAANNGYAKVFDLGTWSMEATLKRWDGNKFYRSPIIANVYDDSRMEMVFGTYAGIQLISGTHGQYQTIALQNDIHTVSDRMLIQDIDNDGENEIVALAHGTGYGYNSYNFVTCYDTSGDASPGTSSKDFLYSYRRIAVAENIPSYDPDDQINYYTLTINTQGNGTVTKNPDKAQYTNGEIVAISATADAGWAFDHWNDEQSGNINAITITIDANTTITATFTEIISYTLTIHTVGSGTVTPPSETSYPVGTVVDLTTTPGISWQFTGWSGDLIGSTNPATITMDTDKTITATFTQLEYTLTINTIGAGTVIKSLDQTSYQYGDVVQLTAVPDTGWLFTGWSDDLTEDANPGSITITGNNLVTATFTQNEYTLTINSIGGGTVATSPNPPYHYGDIIQLTATATLGYTFSGWSGDLTDSTNPMTITMDADKTVTASFTQIEYALDLTIAGSGSVARTPDQTTYYYGDVVLLTAIPETGWLFTGWSTDLIGSTNPAIITIDGNKAVTATFTQIEYTLDITIVGHGIITKNPDQSTYHHGDLVQLTATPDHHWIFSGWSDDVAGNTNPTTITVSGNMTITANFSFMNSQCTTPANPSGPTVRTSSMLYTYWTNATDQDGDQIYYLWDWGDGTTSGWQGPYNSGRKAYAHHRWDNDGIYHITVKAKDTEGCESEWSEPTTVYMTRPTYVLGLINNFETNGEISRFNANLVVTVRVNPFELQVYYSGEQFIFSKAYNGFVGPNGIIGFFNIATP